MYSEYNRYLSFMEATKWRVHHLISLMYIYFDSRTSQIFQKSNSSKEVPDLAHFGDWEVTLYPTAISHQNYFFSTSKIHVCGFFKLLMKALQRLAFEVVRSFHLFSFWYSPSLQLKFRTLKMLLSGTKFSWCSIKVRLDYQSFVPILQLSIPERALVRLELASLCLLLSN